MGEALIIRSGGGYSNGGYIPKTEIITNNYSFKVPNAKGQQFAVRIFGGGGGGGSSSGGGGGGNMNYAVLTLNEGDIIPIIIGDAGINGSKSDSMSNGGTTSFGEYLSATGGEHGKGGQGGNGGAGGGGGLNAYGGSFFRSTNGGHGTYGGGGGASVEFQGKWVIPDNTPNDFSKNGKYNCVGGNGGTYGGGGGGYFPGISVGGWGNGADIITGNEQNGLNTMNIAAELDFVGNGEHGGANTFTWERINSDYGRYYFSGKLSNNIGSGGGGYGGCGGNSAIRHVIQNYSNGYGSWVYACGGGGGFGAKGGDAGRMTGGGGGGWGGRGGSGEINTSGFSLAGGYGGGYGPDGYGHGYGTSDGSNKKVSAMPGICIISYMQTLQS